MTAFAALTARRWFAQHEGKIAPPSERVRLVVLAYAVGGLGYLVVNRWNAAGPFHTLELPIDRKIPFIPAFVFLYVLAYAVPALSALFVKDRAELYRTFLAFGLNALICFPIYVLFPVEYPRTDVAPSGLSGSLLTLVRLLDRPVNCFPSHHISTVFTTFLAVQRQDRRWGPLFGAVAILVAASTLFVKQHYVVDVPAGITIALVTYSLAFPSRDRAKV